MDGTKHKRLPFLTKKPFETLRRCATAPSPESKFRKKCKSLAAQSECKNTIPICLKGKQRPSVAYKALRTAELICVDRTISAPSRFHCLRRHTGNWPYSFPQRTDYKPVEGRTRLRGRGDVSPRAMEQQGARTQHSDSPAYWEKAALDYVNPPRPAAVLWKASRTVALWRKATPF